MNLFRNQKRLWKRWKLTRLSRERVRELSLYPEQPQKPLSQIRRELFHLCRDDSRGSWSVDATILHYFNMGIDRLGQEVSRYVFQVEFDTARNAKQPASASILKDKWATATLLRLYGVDTTRPLFVKSPFFSDVQALEALRSSPHSRFFAKSVDGKQGEGSFSFEKCSGGFAAEGVPLSDAALCQRLEGCIVEPYIPQHETLQTLYPLAVASLRIVTVRRKGKIHIILAALFLGAGGSTTSNLHQGGLRVPIDLASGALGEKAIRLQVKRGFYTHHPDSGLPFADFTIPFWPQVLDLVSRAHQCFHRIHSIGWDVAITPSGPIIIEGNEEWGTVSFQFTNGPGREIFEKFFT